MVEKKSGDWPTGMRPPARGTEAQSKTSTEVQQPRGNEKRGGGGSSQKKLLNPTQVGPDLPHKETKKQSQWFSIQTTREVQRGGEEGGLAGFFGKKAKVTKHKGLSKAGKKEVTEESPTRKKRGEDKKGGKRQTQEKFGRGT